ncbi:MAG: hypothetical protein LLG97_04745 [Deltaproteobacteria bacterium]|nr:hypothetical protein [Deltaproteobacteria bacterium]
MDGSLPDEIFMDDPLPGIRRKALAAAGLPIRSYTIEVNSVKADQC